MAKPDAMYDNLSPNFLKAVQFFEAENPALVKCLRELHDECKEMLKIAPAYDLNENLQFNGLRSFVKIICLYMSRIVSLASKSPNRRRRRLLKEYTDLAPILVKQLEILKLVLKRSHGLEASDIGSPDSVDSRILEALMQIDEQDVRPVFALTEKNFWLCKSLRRVLNIYLATILFEAYGFSKLFGSSQKTECLTQFSLHASVYDLRKVWSAGEKLPNRLLIKICAFPRGHVSTVRLLRQSKWTVPITGSVVEASDASPVSDFTDKKNSVKAMLIRYGRRGQSPGDSLIMHMHGGGYIALSPKSHEGCLRRWSQKLKVPVISIDYRLSPEHRYPCALQDALDSYLFLTSGSPEVVDKIGYHPKNIVVCGDSAGGNLCVALTYVLNDIRKKQAGISMPTAISVQFPATNFVIGCFSPSRILTAVDCFLGIGIGNACMAAYASTGPDEDRKTSIKTQRMPWYRGEVWQESVQKLQTNLNEVYFNLLAANFREMADIPLFVQACEFDPLLDDAIHIAKLWCGPVQVDVIENVMHGFLAFQDFSAEARRGGQICADRLAQALKLDSYTSESKS